MAWTLALARRCSPGASLALALATAPGCCFTPTPAVPIAAPPATSVVAGGGPQLPSTTPGEALPISPGFADPMILHGVAGGPRDAAAAFGPDCRGQLPMQPSHRFELRASYPYLRIMVRGDDDLTLVVRTPGGLSRCNDDSDGLNPMVDGAFEPGIYDVYVGRYSAGTPAPYDLGISTNAAVTPTTMLGMPVGSGTVVAGTPLRSGVLSVTSASTAPVSVGDTCTYSEVSIPPTSAGHDARWTITCGTQILYGAGNTGYGRTSDPSWPPGTLAFDAETTEVDTDPALEWTATEIRLRDDATGPFGAYEIGFSVPGAP